jgi:RNA polymerase sigma factor (sigma-70 family)
VVSTLTRVFGARHLEVVEDAVQAALMGALTTWADRGLPEDPSAWLYRVAHNQVLDALRRASGRARILDRAGAEATELVEPSAPRFSAEVDDDLLRMLFVCCHEAVPQESRLVLALKTLCGFGTGEIALRMFSSEANVQKRLQRARDRLRELDPGTDTPPVETLRSRLPSVLEVLYLLFNEGYLSAHPDEAIRRELCEEAVRLCTLLVEHPIGDAPESWALLALMIFHAARLSARVDRLGRLVLLEDQDRELWDREMIGYGGELLARAAQGQTLSRYHVEAAIAAEHCLSPSFQETRWSQIAELYGVLDRLAPSPLHAMNRAVAIAEWQGPEAALASLEALTPPPWLVGFYLWDSVLGELHRRAGHVAEARRHIERALAGAPTEAERALLTRRLASLA